MATVFRVTLKFTFVNPLIAGFSERYDFVDGGAGQSYWQSTAQKVAAARRTALSQSWMISKVTVGTLAPKLSAKTHKYFAAQTLIQLCPDLVGGTGLLGVADSPNVAVYVKQKFTGKSRTIARQMRGVPDTWWDNATLTNAAGIMTAFFTFLLVQQQIDFTVNPTSGSANTFNLMCSQLQRISSRRTGRPFLPLRGRRSKRPA